MTRAWSYLDEHDLTALRAVVAFLDKRLKEQATIDWALSLIPAQRVERLAIEHLLDGKSGLVLDEPWATAWRMIEESWSAPSTEEGPSTAIYGIRERLSAGDRSGAIISQIVRLVTPSLKVERIDSWRWKFIQKPRRPRTFDHLLSAKLTSGNLVDLNVLGLATLNDIAFLKALGGGLESAVNHGLEVARRLGWEGQQGFAQLGGLARVAYITNTSGEGGDPDTYHRGIAPSVKLLYAVVARIAELSTKEALPFVQRWRSTLLDIHTRLWAAAARDPELASPEQVNEFLSDLPDRYFWDLSGFPEVVELRALRFGDFGYQAQKSLAKRIRKGPPRNYWPRKMEAAKIKISQTYRAVRELKRIEIAGGILPPDEQAWINANIQKFPDLTVMTFEEGFPVASRVSRVLPNPDTMYDELAGTARLRALETALTSSRGSWNEDPADRACDWMLQPDKTLLVLCDFEAAENGGDEFPHVWNRFGWAHSPRGQDSPNTPRRELQSEANRVLKLLSKLSEECLSGAIEGISDWLRAWEHHIIHAALSLTVWLRVWPIAVEATNSTSEVADDVDLTVTDRSSNDGHEPLEIDTLNSPVGKLVGVFLNACPSIKEVSAPFEPYNSARQMRDAVISAPGRSGLIVRHRLIEDLPYFLQADQQWAHEYLFAPLLKDDVASLALWSAISRRTHFTKVLEIIGEAMALRATDSRLGRETRQGLVFSLIIESLYALQESRAPAVPYSHIQQMLRSIEDEVRAFAANAIQQFIRDLSVNEPEATEALKAAELFRSAAAPFLREVWPQERSLATPGVSGGFADLPATSKEAFVEAVHAIERFLVPFKCWSMNEYGFYGDEKFAIINSEAKATALLRLLDLTIGISDVAVIPYELSEALDQIRFVAPELIKNQIYRRLSAMARR